jgi:hypothetical protein
MGKKMENASPSSRRRPGSSENTSCEALKIDVVCFARVPDWIPACAEALYNGEAGQ